MDLLELDKRIGKGLERLELSLNEYEEKIGEAKSLKEYFENQTVELRNSYKQKLKELEDDLSKDKEVLSSNIQDFNDLYDRTVGLFEELNAGKKDFDMLKKQFNEAVEGKWKELEEENSKRQSTFESMITNRIDTMEKIYDERITEIGIANRRNAEYLFNIKKQLEDSDMVKKVKKLFGK